MDDIEDTVKNDAKLRRRSKSNRFRKNEKYSKHGINQIANLGPQSESTVIDEDIVPIINELAERGYDNRGEFNKCLNVIKRRYKFQGRNSDLLRVYKLMVNHNLLKPHKFSSWYYCAQSLESLPVAYCQ